FLIWHYAYILLSTIIGSILLYPVKNIAYIDALFFAAGSSTQAGLNTVDVNTLVLWQQMVVYIISMFTNPIVIHSAVVFLRLYWFEKHIKGIGEISKLQSKMRRTATSLAQGETTGSNWRDRRFSFRSSGTQGKVDGTSSSSSGSNEEKDKNMFVNPPVDRDIKFGDLPSPKAKEYVAPRDMYMSINIMQRSRRPSNDAINEGPALVIKGPREQDEENERLENVAKYGDDIYSNHDNNSMPTSRLRRFSLSLKKSKLSKLSLSSEDDDTEDEADGGGIRRARTHADGPTPSNITGDQEPKKLTKRSYTLEVPPVSGTNIKKTFPKNYGRTTTFDRILSSALGKRREDTVNSIDTNNLRNHMSSNYLSWQPTIARNSNFVDLSDEQKEELGGVEYRTLKILAKILVIYFFGFHLLAVIILLPWGIHTKNYADMFFSEGFTPTWWSFFTASSSFNDLGFTLTPDSMISFQVSPYVLLFMSFFIVAGNTGFPVLLRFIIWVTYKISRFGSQMHESLSFLLDHPRRCFTLLFPSSANWWLFFILVTMNSIDLVLFIVLDLNNPIITGIPTGFRVVCGLFQAFSTRTAGFSCVNLAALHPSIQVSYLVMMYISVLPVAISIRRTNVYEERSLGIFYISDENGEGDNSSSKNFVASHLRRQLSFDLWYIVLGLFIICIAEGGKLKADSEEGMTIFSILFEVVSAYGTVGMSLGYEGVNASLSSQFSVISKLVIIAMMIRGRHRGLPYSLDRAIILPSKKLSENDQEQERRQMMKRTLT
ncbi:potassium transport protein TRK1/TRK2, partial [Nadsonia fulvescens var. elongata DSM 6958]